jgi:hypothetical protein
MFLLRISFQKRRETGSAHLSFGHHVEVQTAGWRRKDVQKADARRRFERLAGHRNPKTGFLLG